MKLKNSQFTESFLKESYMEYGDVGLYWGSMILLTGCFTVTPDRFLFMKFGYSNCGKTVSDKVSLFWAEHLHPISISSRITPAGLGKLYKLSKSDEERQAEWKKFYNSGLLLVEDLSKATTKYLRLTTVSFLAGLTRDAKFDDVTFEGAGFNVPITKEPKKIMVSGTPAHWEELSSSDIFLEHVDRRSLQVMFLLTDKEWAERKKRALDEGKENDDSIISKWRRMISSCYAKNGINIPKTTIKLNRKTVNGRANVFNQMMKVKAYPENVAEMIDALAKGHAMINGRDYVVSEDYEIIDKIFSRALYISDMKKKEFLIVEEVLRNKGPHGVPEKDLVYLLRMRSKREDIPEFEMVRKTIHKHIGVSKYLTFNKVSGSGVATCPQTYIDISPTLDGIFKQWEKEIMEIIT